ncbi:hypothetical protein LCGC14_0680430, partial [marine sediment metagenome]
MAIEGRRFRGIPVLFLAAGRRMQMAQMFQERGFEIFSYESDLTSPIAQRVSVIESTLPWSDPNFMDEVFPVCMENNIELIIPFQDNAVQAASRLGGYLRSKGTQSQAVCSTKRIAEICYDKSSFALWMVEHFPGLYPSVIDGSPMVAKPKYGAGSKTIYHIDDELDFERYKPYINSKKWITQRKIKGTEYSVDCYFDLIGDYVDSVPRRRLIMGSSGEVIKSITERNVQLQAISKKVGERLGLKGPANMQYIVEDKTTRIYLFEINARFGGGYTLSIQAGMDAINLI